MTICLRCAWITVKIPRVAERAALFHDVPPDHISLHSSHLWKSAAGSKESLATTGDASGSFAVPRSLVSPAGFARPHPRPPQSALQTSVSWGKTASRTPSVLLDAAVKPPGSLRAA